MDEKVARLGPIGRARQGVAALEVLARVRAEMRQPTPGERETLAGWPGWGPMAPVFAPKDETWGDISDQVQALLSADDFRAGEQATYNAFYTPEPVASAMWQVLAELGFTGGAVAELGCGSGRFFATAPDGAQLTGVERDPTSAAICQLLYPQANVIRGELEGTRLPSQFAAVVGNVPFGKVGVFDPVAPRAVTWSLHNYFLWRAVKALTPGGVAVLLTSRYSMDSGDYHRHEIAEMADFLGAVRLPNGGLEGGTEALADVVILRKRSPEESRGGYRWFETSATPSWTYGTTVNDWWVERPDMVLGEMTQGKTSQYGLSLVVNRRDGDLPLQVALPVALRKLATEALGSGLGWSAASSEVAALDTAGVVTADGRHEGSMRLIEPRAKGGRPEVTVVTGGREVPLPVKKAGDELVALLRLRDLAVRLIGLEAEHWRADAEIEPTRAAARAAYAAYVKRFGYLNRSKLVEGPADPETGLPTYSRRNPTMGGFRHDPDSALTFALEVFDDNTGVGEPAPILVERQNRPHVVPDRVSDPQEALALCLDQHAGRVLLDDIAGRLGVAESEAVAMLAGAVFEDPQSGGWVTADEYLSGDVRAKHAAAVAASERDGRWRANVEALEKVLPRWLRPGEITANLGAPWIAQHYVEQFIKELLGYAASVKHVKAGNQWEVDGPRRLTVAATAKWGTPEVDGYRLIELALNGKTPVVYRVATVDGREVKRKDPDASLVASEKQQQIRERFSQWVWEDPDRCDDLVRLYNQRYNSQVARKFDGRHITVRGLAPWFAAKVYPHQLDYVARALGTPASLCGHPVGAGKTASMAMTAMKMRQSGLARKPLVVVPNHLIEQIDREFRQLFPAARILSASAKTISANRRSFAARCATGDWDVVIITHSAFNAMPVAPETEAAYLDDQTEDLRDALIDAAPDGRMEGRMVKGVARRLDSLKTQVRELRHKARGRDAGVTFEQLGVDYLIVDEFHYYKNLAMPSRTDGFSVRPSKRATDMDVKLTWLSRRGSGRYAALFTGTPVTNTMLELYVILHYTMPQYLKQIGLSSADAWAAAYVQFVTSVDVTVDGGQFQLKTRPALFVNAPELRLLLSQVADIRTAEQLGLKRPAAHERIIAVDPTTLQREYSEELVERVEKAKSGGRVVAKGADNMLKICGDGRRMATDPALVGINDPEPGKLDRAADEIAAIWRDAPDSLQIVFCDIGTPKDVDGAVDPQTYGRLRRMLVDRGMEVGRVRFVHDAKTDAAKAQLFAECRAGKVSVIFGSTDKLGVGTNIQDRVIAMHHVDAPYRPADVEQRDGRGLRPGNRYERVHVYRYVTTRTFDAYMWQLLSRKIGFITQILSGNLDRTVEDVASDQVLGFAAAKAAATGQPLLLERAQVEADVKRLRGMQAEHRNTVQRMTRQIPSAVGSADNMESDAEAWQAIADALSEFTDDDREALLAVVDGYKEYRPVSGVVAGLTVTSDYWVSEGRDGGREPLINIDGGGGAVELRLRRFNKPDRIVEKFTEKVGEAVRAAEILRRKAVELRVEIGNMRQAQAEPFADEAELTAALARLDQIDAALQDEATHGHMAGNVEAADSVAARSSDPVQPEPSVVDVAEPDDDDVSSLFAELMEQEIADVSSLFAELMEQEIAKEFADLFGPDAFA